jgi:hypothetical protein
VVIFCGPDYRSCVPAYFTQSKGYVHYGGEHLSEMTTQKSEKKWTFERKKNNPKEQNLKNQMDI